MGYKKPSCVFKNFVEEVLSLKDGFILNNKKINVVFRCLSCDTPAKAFVCGVLFFKKISKASSQIFSYSDTADKTLKAASQRQKKKIFKQNSRSKTKDKEQKLNEGDSSD